MASVGPYDTAPEVEGALDRPTRIRRKSRIDPLISIVAFAAIGAEAGSWTSNA